MATTLGWVMKCNEEEELSLKNSHDSSACHQGVNDIFALKSITVSSFFDFQKHEDITVRRRDEDVTLSSFSLYYVWRNDLHLHNRMIGR